MHKKAILVIGLVVLAGAGILVLQNSRQQGSFGQKLIEAQASQKVLESNEVKVDITGFAFKDQIIKIKKGTAVKWANLENAPHTVTSDNGKFLDSPVLGRNGSFEKKFDSVGTFRYHCTPHPNMLAAVIVID